MQEYGADVNIKNNSCNVTAFFAAVFANEPESVKLLIEQGSEVNFSIKTATKPLLFAIYNRHKAVIEILLNCGVDMHFSEFINGTIISFKDKPEKSRSFPMMMSHCIKRKLLNLVDDKFLSFWESNLP